MSISGTVSAVFQANDARTIGLTPNQTLKVNQTGSAAFTDGAGALAANILYQNVLSLSAGVNNVDLSGALSDQFGTSIVAVRIKAIYIENLGTGNLTVGNGTNPWNTFITGTGTVVLDPGGFLLAACKGATGWTVTAATGDILKFAGTGTETFRLIFFGASS